MNKPIPMPKNQRELVALLKRVEARTWRKAAECAARKNPPATPAELSESFKVYEQDREDAAKYAERVGGFGPDLDGLRRLYEECVS